MSEINETKKFSQDLYDENDMSAKLIAVDYLENTGFYKLDEDLNEQPEQFKKLDFEIRLIEKNKLISVEVERKKVWTKDYKWQGFPTIDVPYRKKDSKADLFIMVNKNMNTIAITKMKTVTTSPTSTKKTIYTNKERFFNVPLDAFKIMKKNDGIWNQC